MLQLKQPSAAVFACSWLFPAGQSAWGAGLQLLHKSTTSSRQVSAGLLNGAHKGMGNEPGVKSRAGICSTSLFFVTA